MLRMAWNAYRGWAKRARDVRQKWRPATYAETLPALAEDTRREREGRFKTIPEGRS
jgi:hypothetical protein